MEDSRDTARTRAIWCAWDTRTADWAKRVDEDGEEEMLREVVDLQLDQAALLLHPERKRSSTRIALTSSMAINKVCERSLEIGDGQTKLALLLFANQNRKTKFETLLQRKLQDLVSSAQPGAEMACEAVECVVCMDRVAALRFVCGHLVCCASCSRNLRPSGAPTRMRCPMCRKRTHGDELSCGGMNCRYCTRASSSRTTSQPLFQPSSSAETSPRKSRSDRGEWSWDDWADREVQHNDGFRSSSRLFFAVRLDGCAIFDMQGNRLGASSEFTVQPSEMRKVFRLGDTWSLSKPLSIVINFEEYAVHEVEAKGGRINVFLNNGARDALISILRHPERAAVIVCTTQHPVEYRKSDAMYALSSHFARQLGCGQG